MCTVTYIPVKDSCYIISNRDERFIRKEAIPPAANNMNGNILLYPKDADAGGTWITATGDGHAGVLLNGAFEKHMPSPPYRKSRGLVFLEIMEAECPVSFFSAINLRDIEPFTLITLAGELHECRWNGRQKFILPLQKQQPYIWSSVTLYDEMIKKEREKWFSEFIEKHPMPTMTEALAFHQFAGEGDQHKDLRMNRKNEVFTVSITGMHIRKQDCRMRYHELSSGKVYHETLAFCTPSVKDSFQ